MEDTNQTGSRTGERAERDAPSEVSLDLEGGTAIESLVLAYRHGDELIELAEVPAPASATIRGDRG